MKANKEVTVDPTAIVHPTAELAPGVTIGPYSVIGEDVRIGRGTRVGPHAVIDKWTTVGEDNEILQFAAIGAPPQDVSYKGERTEVVIGDRNVIREFVTVHRASAKGTKRTVIGSGNFLMNYAHVAHDCVVGDNVIMANSATLGGHVAVGDHAVISGLVGVHQFVRIGAYAIIGGASAVFKDVVPFAMAVGGRARVYGLNVVGLKRKGFTREEIADIKRAYAILFRSSLPLKEAVARIEAEMPGSVHAARITEFIKGTKRGLARQRSERDRDDEEA